MPALAPLQGMARPLDSDPPTRPRPRPKPGSPDPDADPTPTPVPPAPPVTQTPAPPTPAPPEDQSPSWPGDRAPVIKPPPGPRPKPVPRPQPSGDAKPWLVSANGDRFRLACYRRINDPQPRDPARVLLNGLVSNAEWGGYQAALTFIERGPHLPGGVRVDFARLFDESLDTLQIYHSDSAWAGLGETAVTEIGGHFFQYEWDGHRYQRQGPFGWSAKMGHGQPDRLPGDTAVIQADPGGFDGYNYGESTSDGWPEPGFAIFEWHHFHNPLAGAVKQRQFWGVYRHQVQSTHPDSVVVGHTREWQAWQLDDESGWLGGSTKTYSAPYTFLNPWDPHFDTFSVFRGRAKRTNAFSWGTYDGCHLWRELEEHRIDAATGDVTARYGWRSRTYQADTDGQPPE